MYVVDIISYFTTSYNIVLIIFKSQGLTSIIYLSVKYGHQHRFYSIIIIISDVEKTERSRFISTYS
jgi:hypothetical protein